MDAEFSYHMGGALYIPQTRAPSPEPVPSSALPESVPSSETASTDMSPANTPNSISSAAVKDGGIMEESHRSYLDEDEDDSSSGSNTGSAEYTRDDSEPLSEPSRPLKRSHQEGESSKHETSNTETRSNKRSRKRQKYQRWYVRLEELKRFKAKHGHCRLPKSSGSLYIWLKDQRTSYLNPDSPKCLKDVQERERRVEELGTVLGASLWDGPTPQRAIEASNWDERLEQLKFFKAKHGHCGACGPLYKWLHDQRTIYFNPNSPRYLKVRVERKRRMRELEAVLGAKFSSGRSPQCT